MRQIKIKEMIKDIVNRHNKSLNLYFTQDRAEGIITYIITKDNIVETEHIRYSDITSDIVNKVLNSLNKFKCYNS